MNQYEHLNGQHDHEERAVVKKRREAILAEARRVDRGEGRRDLDLIQLRKGPSAATEARLAVPPFPYVHQCGNGRHSE